MKAILEFELKNPALAEKAIGVEKIPKTKIFCETRQNILKVTIESENIAAFSAAINSYLRSAKVILGIDVNERCDS